MLVVTALYVSQHGCKFPHSDKRTVPDNFLPKRRQSRELSLKGFGRILRIIVTQTGESGFGPAVSIPLVSTLQDPLALLGNPKLTRPSH